MSTSTVAVDHAPIGERGAARAEGLSKVYGVGDTQVVALDNVTSSFRSNGSRRSWAPRVPASPP